jgi:hypothetical protein
MLTELYLSIPEIVRVVAFGVYLITAFVIFIDMMCDEYVFLNIVFSPIILTLALLWPAVSVYNSMSRIFGERLFPPPPGKTPNDSENVQ